MYVIFRKKTLEFCASFSRQMSICKIIAMAHKFDKFGAFLFIGSVKCHSLSLDPVSAKTGLCSEDQNEANDDKKN
jgi:hypothetical protein